MPTPQKFFEDLGEDFVDNYTDFVGKTVASVHCSTSIGVLITFTDGTQMTVENGPGYTHPYTVRFHGYPPCLPPDPKCSA